MEKGVFYWCVLWEKSLMAENWSFTWESDDFTALSENSWRKQALGNRNEHLDSKWTKLGITGWKWSKITWGKIYRNCLLQRDLTTVDPEENFSII